MWCHQWQLPDKNTSQAQGPGLPCFNPTDHMLLSMSEEAWILPCMTTEAAIIGWQYLYDLNLWLIQIRGARFIVIVCTSLVAQSCLTFVTLPRGSGGKESPCNAGDLGLIFGLGRIPWRREWKPTSGFLPGEFHGQRSLAGYSPWCHKELDVTERLGTYNSNQVSQQILKYSDLGLLGLHVLICGERGPQWYISTRDGGCLWPIYSLL